MKTSWTNVLGSYPSLAAKNSTSQTSKDGTPINADLIDELFGILQAATYQGNVTPSGSTETYDASDFVSGIRNISGSPGEIVYRVNHFPADSVLLGERLLYLNGSTVLVSSYPDLVEHAYCGNSVNSSADGFYKCNGSDGTSRSTSGIYLYLPDYRGYFIRCAGGYNNGIDPDLRYPHSVQSDGIKDHSHYITDTNGPSDYYMTRFFQNLVSGGTLSQNWSSTPDDEIFAAESSDTNADETRPVNRIVHAFVRY